MTDDERFALVEQMRAAQKRYFRDRDNLTECKGLERLVDEMLAARREPPGLFDAPKESETQASARDFEAWLRQTYTAGERHLIEGDGYAYHGYAVVVAPNTHSTTLNAEQAESLADRIRRLAATGKDEATP